MALLLWLVASPVPLAAEELGTVEIIYLSRQGDPYYAPHRAYTGLVLRDRHPALDGAEVAIRESRILSRGMGVKLELEAVALAPGEDVTTALGRLVETKQAGVFLLDLPLLEMQSAVRAFAGREVLMFNIRHRADELRGPACSPVLFHTIPSNAMLMDALAQYLYKRSWTDVLMLTGGSDADTATSAAFLASAKKFRLNVIDRRPFVLSNDPRLRDQTNINLLTGSASYDVVFLADSVGEFGRHVPYQTRLPRPVVGSEGLVASAWYWTWERHGAPQLNQRFDRLAKRPMEDQDWAAWAAVKSVVEAVQRSRSRDVATLRSTLLGQDFSLDTYKGAPGSYRPWDHQLRQAILLHTHNAVIERAPIEGFLHEKNNLDTLGIDARESSCRLR